VLSVRISSQVQYARTADCAIGARYRCKPGRVLVELSLQRPLTRQPAPLCVYRLPMPIGRRLPIPNTRLKLRLGSAVSVTSWRKIGW
jgi:hypothetical protein